MDPRLKFLMALRNLYNAGAIKTVKQAYDFAKNQFGQLDDLFKRQIEQVFKKPVDKAPKPGEGGITSIKNAPKKETPDQASGIMASEEASPLMQKLEKGADILREFKRPGMDLTTGMARTAARVILDNAGIKVPEKVDPLEAIAQEFGADVLMDLRDVADELIEKERAGKITESMGEFLEKRGMFNLQRGRTDMPKGMSDEELQQIKKEVDQEKMLKDFDPTDRTENAMGGRIGFEDGTPKNKKGIMKVIKKIPKVGKIAGGLEAAYNTLSKKFGPDVLKTADEIPPKEPSELAKAVKGFEARNPDPKRILTDDEYEDFVEELGGGDYLESYNFDGTVGDAQRILREQKEYEDYMYDQYKTGKLDPEPGDKSEARMKLLRDRAEEMEATGDRRLMSEDDMDELSELEAKYLKDVDEAYGLDTKLKKELNEMKKLGATKTAERFELKQKYPGLDENLITFIVDDPDPQRKAEVLATIDQAFELMKRGKSPDEILSILKKATDRTKQARGGLSYLMGM